MACMECGFTGRGFHLCPGINGGYRTWPTPPWAAPAPAPLQPGKVIYPDRLTEDDIRRIVREELDR